MAPKNLLLPMKIDAFVFNSTVCNGGPDQAKIAPITQPNYTFLQLKDHLAQNDILDHVDLHNSSPSNRNPRYMDVGKATVRQNRVGVYVHWSLPRPLRSGVADTEKAVQDNPFKSTVDDDEPDCDKKKDPSAIRYPELPNRWLVIRSLDPTASTTVPNQPDGLKAVTAWVVESDKTRSIDQIPESVDLEVDVAPFITSFVPATGSVGDISVEEQAEVFIGACTEAALWEKKPKPAAGETRVSLTAASSSSQLFIDYQYHCGSVFSMLDTFSYVGADGKKRSLQSAVADYYVIGWYDDPDNDLMGTLGDAKSRSGRLDALRISINGQKPASDKDAIADWMKLATPATTLCHGAMYDVAWNINKAPEIRPADKLAKDMLDKMPFAVGSTPLDALLAYITDRSESGSVEEGILALQTLLRAEDDGVDAQMAAEDEIQSYNFAHWDGGNHFYLPAQQGKDAGAKPPVDKRNEIRRTNNAQHLLDATRRRIQQLRWDVFSWWWKFISDVDNTHSLESTDILDTQKAIEELSSSAAFLQERIGEPQAPIKTGVMEAFHQRNDPTLVIGGLESAWPVDFNDTLSGRLDNQVMDTADPPPDDTRLGCLPPSVRDAGGRLVREFFSLKDKQVRREDRVAPLYHDGKQPSDPADEKNPWRDRWGDSQPWFPLYMEWEAEYAHVPFQNWDLRKRPARSGLKSKFTYVVTKDIRVDCAGDDQCYKDVRYLSGRSLMLPQPAFSLKIHIERLFATIPPGQLDLLLSPEKRTELLNKLNQLAFLSVPLAGLTDHLTTRYQGSHIKPLARQPGTKPVVLREADKMVRHKGVDLSLIEQESDPTPYGSLPTLLGQKLSGFKPVTHGQMRFTKINIVDKFGQVVHAVDPIPEESPAVYPTVSEMYAIDPVPNNAEKPNVVDPRRSTLSRPEYMQLPPAINQPARLNANFVVRDVDMQDDANAWRPATEFDEPIWGWVVVNYVDQGLQFFLPDGTFYREVRSTASDIKWLPFAAPSTPLKSEQLDALVQQLKSPAYLCAFTDMIMTALRSTVPTPSAYSQFLNSLVGRPLALANMGWSLELGGDSKKNQSTLEDQAKAKLDCGLLDGEAERQYTFPLKLGDCAANYDGLVGYFRFVRVKKDPKDDEEEGKLVMDPSKIYTYFTTQSNLNSNPLSPIDSHTYPRLPAHWLNPRDYRPQSSTTPATDLAAARFEHARNTQLHLLAALFDPFAPITAYTGILPPRRLALPPWTWEAALKRITTFFHAGPVVLTDDVPPFQARYELGPDAYDGVGKTVEGARVGMPALRTADWAWLQPYDVRSEPARQAYMGLEVGGEGVGEAPGWEGGPLTALEGFMQLKGPVEEAGRPGRG